MTQLEALYRCLGRCSDDKVRENLINRISELTPVTCVHCTDKDPSKCDPIGLVLDGCVCSCQCHAG